MLMFGSLKISIEIGIPFKNKHCQCQSYSLGLAKIPLNDHWYSKLLLIESVHLAKNVHEERPQFLNIKSPGAPVGGTLKVFTLMGYFL